MECSFPIFHDYIGVYAAKLSRPYFAQLAQFTATVFVPQLYCRYVFWLAGANQRLR
jgi:hypothetical protein